MRRRGFFVLFGSRRRVSNTSESVQAVCPRCRQQATLQGRGLQTWFTLFFCPIFPVGGKIKISQCSNCGAQFKASPQQVGQQTAVSSQKQMQQAIQMYNSMRASPGNSVTLNNLLMLYLTLQEHDQALSAANEFPQALNASEQCMTTLGRVLLDKKLPADAITWFDAALRMNPNYGEASYCKAVALMHQTPPDLAAANTAARAARTSGLDGAEALVREIEGRMRA